MTDKYRIAHEGAEFIVNESAGVTVGVYKTQQEARREVESCERDDFMLNTARSLVKAATDAYMQLHNIDRHAAQDWIREAVG